MFLLVLPGNNLMAQSSVHSSSGEGSGTGGSITYSIGQIAVHSDVNSSGSLTGGVQVPYEIRVYQSVEDPAVNVSLQLKAYPNPVSDILNLKVESEELKDLKFRIFDLNGKELLNLSINNQLTEIDMSIHPKGTYFLTVYSLTNKQYDTFKIIKK
tara:strand:- start:7716 stop:8180 length:465 start_codon:yes stop_codon:yes gene_type:complete